MPKLLVGFMGGLIWHRNNQDLAFGLTTPKDTGDCYSLNISTGKVDRWTTSETAVNTSGLHDAELVRWKTFDGRTISGFLYRPPPKFSGKHPVLIVFSLVSKSECPSRAWAVFRDSPFACRSVAWLCRNKCQEIRGCPMRSHAGASSRLYRFLSLSGVLVGVRNTSSSGLFGFIRAR